MKIVKVNGKFLFQNRTGVQRYALELCKALNKQDGVKLELYVPNKKFLDPFDGKVRYISPWFPMQSLFLFEQFVLPFLAGKNLISLSGTGPILAAKQIIALHDTAVWDIPDSYTKSFVLKHRVLQILYRFFGISFITVSNFSRENIARLFRVTEDKIKLIHNGWEHVNSVKTKRHEEFMEEKKAYEKNFLIVGSFAKHKGVEKLISIINSSDRLSRYGFHFVGNKSKIFQSQRIQPRANIRFYEHIDDGFLFFMITHSDGLISPSTYEGFGIPPLEALALGRKVYLNKIPVYEEIYSEVASFFDLDEPNSLKKILINNESYMKEPQLYRFLEKYSWISASKKLIKLVK